MFALQRGEDSWHDSVRLCDDHVNINSTVGAWKGHETENKAIAGAFKGANTASYHDHRSSTNAA